MSKLVKHSLFLTLWFFKSLLSVLVFKFILHGGIIDNHSAIFFATLSKGEPGIETTSLSGHPSLWLFVYSCFFVKGVYAFF